MLKVHQRLGLITALPILAACISGAGATPDRGSYGSTTSRDVHVGIAGLAIGMYGATAYYAAAAPRLDHAPAHGEVKWHKYRIYIHAPGHPPVAVADPAFPMEATIVHTPLARRIDKELPIGPPHAITPADLVAGAAVYNNECAFCHGLPQHPSTVGKHMYPGVPQLWQPHRNGSVVGVSDDPVGETY